MPKVTNTTKHVIRLPESRKFLVPGIATDVADSELKHKHVAAMVDGGTLAVGKDAARQASREATAIAAGKVPGGPRKGPEDAGTTPVLGESEDEEARHPKGTGRASGKRTS